MKTVPGKDVWSLKACAVDITDTLMAASNHKVITVLMHRQMIVGTL